MIFFDQPLDLSNVNLFLKADNISFDQAALDKISDCRDFLDQYLAEQDKPVYGINTGFGDLCDVEVDKGGLEQLQENLVLSHACGWGNKIDPDLVRSMMFLKLVSLSKGHSGISPETFNKLLELYNKDIIPVVYSQGSLGASGDLAPLAHLSLPLIGQGEVYYQGQERKAAELVQQGVFSPVKLKSKEGLALLNGTQFMQAHLLDVGQRAKKLFKAAQRIAALSIVGFNGRKAPFHPSIQLVRKSLGQIAVADEIRQLLRQYEPSSDHLAVQDPYSFRCIPQVHGASLEQINHANDAIVRELNSVSDNPLIFPKEKLILSGGNFHGQILAMQAENLKIALAELGSISERRVFKLLSGKRGLSPFLTQNPGLESGLMIPQYLAASLVSKNKQLSTPAVVDSIDSSNGQEDHVSMGANGALQAHEICNNLEAILAVEWLTAFRAVCLAKRELPENLKGFISKAKQTIGSDFKDANLSEQIHALQNQIYSEELLG